MIEIRLPRWNANDASYMLVEWCFGDGDQVPPGSVVAVIETSKAAEDLVSAEGGILDQLVTPPAECDVGQVVGRLFATEKERSAYHSGEPETSPDGVIITEPARRLLAGAGITEEQVLTLGRRVVRAQDVKGILAHAAGRPPQDGEGAVRTLDLSRTQRAVADVVSTSRATIPAAFTAMRVHLPGPSAAGAGLAARLIQAVAALTEHHPMFFGRLEPDGRLTVRAGAHVAVTVDVGSGLYLPVIRNAQNLTGTQIEAALSDFRRRAFSGRFAEGDLSGANIGVALHQYTDVVVAVPLIPPGHTCMVSLAGTVRELVRTRAGDVAEQRVTTIGLAYDHRVVNGRDAVRFLRDVRARIGKPDEDGRRVE